MTADTDPDTSQLKQLEPRLRHLLPPELYVTSWVRPDRDTLMAVHDHLRTLYRLLVDYTPRQVLDHGGTPGELSHERLEGTLMFTDLAGFTPMMEGFSVYGAVGAEAMHFRLNEYFSRMLEIISKSGGNLLEFTGDALLVQFDGSRYQSDAQQAIKTALRMQRAMSDLDEIDLPSSNVKLAMRIGIHSGKYLSSLVGTPRRMEHVLFGQAVRQTKLAEGAGVVGRVNVTDAVRERIGDEFRLEPNDEAGYHLVVDDFTEETLGDYELTALNSRRLPSAVVLDRSIAGLTEAIESILSKVEPIASFLPRPALDFIVQHANRNTLPAQFVEATVLFVYLVGVASHIDNADAQQTGTAVSRFSELFALVNAVVEANGGVLARVTYHHDEPDIKIFFGLPHAHADDPVRAARAAHQIRELVCSQQYAPGGEPLSVKIGLSQGLAFAGEVGVPRGRREWDVSGDLVNTAARLMMTAENGQILMTESVYHAVWQAFDITPLRERLALKGKSRPIPVFSLDGPLAG